MKALDFAPHRQRLFLQPLLVDPLLIFPPFVTRKIYLEMTLDLVNFLSGKWIIFGKLPLSMTNLLLISVWRVIPRILSSPSACKLLLAHRILLIIHSLLICNNYFLVPVSPKAVNSNVLIVSPLSHALRL